MSLPLNEAMGTIFCYAYCNYHSPCQFFPPTAYCLITFPDKPWLNASLLITHTLRIHFIFWGGAMENRHTLCTLISLHQDDSDSVFITGFLKFRSLFVLCIPSFPQFDSWKLLTTFSIASPLPHNSWTTTALFLDYLKLRSELVPNKSLTLYQYCVATWQFQKRKNKTSQTLWELKEYRHFNKIHYKERVFSKAHIFCIILQKSHWVSMANL